MVVFCSVRNKLNIDIALRTHFNRQLQQFCDDDGQGLMYYHMVKTLKSNPWAHGVHLTPVGGHELMFNNR